MSSRGLGWNWNGGMCAAQRAQRRKGGLGQDVHGSGSRVPEETKGGGLSEQLRLCYTLRPCAMISVMLVGYCAVSGQSHG